MKRDRLISLEIEGIPENWWKGSCSAKIWRLVSPNNEVFNFIGLKHFRSFCIENHLSPKVLKNSLNKEIKGIARYQTQIRKNTVGWKLCLIK